MKIWMVCTFCLTRFPRPSCKPLFSTPVRPLAAGVGSSSPSYVPVCSSSSVTGLVSGSSPTARVLWSLSKLLLYSPPCGSTTTGATYPELGLAGSDSLCRSKAPPPLLATFTYEETPPYCIATISIWSPDPSTIPISNRCLTSPKFLLDLYL
ncbi:hypothetical protein Bca52824_071177 [Brassica carinata]|uniref:Uncharacterized protein n=1 Tax=Brassica carinata TaxID=52824 RepID=A0A8X7Q6P4_BRACI|nr:hypothetical protein Bca52824_071177 [Brassica carinata]